MRIVVLDGYTLNPGDNPWTGFASLGECTVYDRTPPELVVERALDADAVIVNKVVMDREVMSALPKLRYVGILATGYDVVDLQAAGNLGIVVSNVNAYGVDSVAQHCMALLLELCRATSVHDADIKAGGWSGKPDFCYWRKAQTELTGLTMGIMGHGNIGKRVGELAHAFGMNVLAWSRSRFNAPAYQPFAFVDVDELFRRSDVISLHCPLTDETRGLVNAERIRIMKDGAILLNTARGALINEVDVAAALKDGKLGGLGTDVLAVEPPEPDNPLLNAPHTLLTPHIAWATLRARQTLMGMAVDNLRAFVRGVPVNVVNAPYLNKSCYGQASF